MTTDVHAPTDPSDAGTAPPHWDVDSIFPGLESRELRSAHESVLADLGRLTATFDQHDIRGGDPRPPDRDDLDALDEVVPMLNQLMDDVRRLNAYLYARTATDVRDDDAVSMQSQLQTELTELVRLSKRFEAWVGRLDADALVAASEVAADHERALRKAQEAAHHQLSEAEEGLVADLRLTGSVAWARLHRDVTARLTADVTQPDGTTRTLPMSVVRGLATDPDQAVRRAAYDAELEAWESVAVPLAAALNGAKGEAGVLDRRRGWTDALAPSLHANGVDRATLDAMTAAVVDALPDFRRYLRAKARHLGHGGGLPWWDLLAPVGPPGSGRFSWDAALDLVSSSFGTYAGGLAGLVERAATERWIDAEPRDGKVGGAFCLPVGGGESRVLLNFDGSFDSVQTLAHELGHAYHNTNLAERTALQRQTPMALAETASIFCETIVTEAGLAAAEGAQRLVVLDTDLQGATQVVVDIHSRFLFESELCRRRALRTLSVDELCELMLDCQRQAYGDGLDEAHLHPWMWAVKSHYFTPFYNWPYTYGLLFGIGLYSRYVDDPDRFRRDYDELLASTGMLDAAGLAHRFGIDVADRSFWDASLDVLRRRIDAFAGLVDLTDLAG